MKILESYGISECKSVNTPLNINFDLNVLGNGNCEKKYVTACRQIIGNLTYVVMGRRPDLCYSVSVLSRFLEQANEILYITLKRVLRYVKKTLHFKLKFSTDSNEAILGYVDSDWGGDVIDRKSTTGCLFGVFNSTVSWISRKKTTTSISSTESGYVALSLAVTEACQILELNEPITIYEDNQSAVKIAYNPESEKYNR